MTNYELYQTQYYHVSPSPHYQYILQSHPVNEALPQWRAVYGSSAGIWLNNGSTLL